PRRPLAVRAHARSRPNRRTIGRAQKGARRAVRAGRGLEIARVGNYSSNCAKCAFIVQLASDPPATIPLNENAGAPCSDIPHLENHGKQADRSWPAAVVFSSRWHEARQFALACPEGRAPRAAERAPAVQRG